MTITRTEVQLNDDIRLGIWDVPDDHWDLMHLRSANDIGYFERLSEALDEVRDYIKYHGARYVAEDLALVHHVGEKYGQCFSGNSLVAAALEGHAAAPEAQSR
jgi:hypothetical protein